MPGLVRVATVAGTDRGRSTMHRTPRLILPLSLVLLGVLVSLVVTSGATGRSEAAPTNTKEPSISYVYTIRLDVTAANADGKTTVRANATAVVPAKEGAPTELSPPKVSGQAVVGQTLTATSGTWKGNQPISYTFKWQSCNVGITSCPATGASGTSYTVRSADVGKRVRVKVLAKN